MGINLHLLLSLLAVIIGYLLARLHRIYDQLSLSIDALTDIKAGNLNRYVLAQESDLTKRICYNISGIAMNSQSRLIKQKQSKSAYKRLITSPSHNIPPLASLASGA